MNEKYDEIKRPNMVAVAVAQLGSRQISALLVCGLITAILYSICFTGESVLPQASFTLFCTAVLIIMYVGLERMGYLRNKKAFLWAAPIVIVSAYNGIFDLSVLNYLNVCVIYILFAMLGISAVRDEKPCFQRMDLWINLMKAVFGNWIVAFALLTRLMGYRGGVKLRNSTIFKVFAGICLAAPVLMIIFMLMLAGDAVFNALVQNIYDYFDLRSVNIVGHIFAISIGAVYFTGYGFNLRHMNKKLYQIREKKCDSVIAITFLSLVNFLFLVFCLVQVTFLFTGGYMKLPKGLVYSEYAREGFFQLLFITVINFSVITVFLRGFPDCLKIKVIKGLLYALCLFTAILIFSSFYRMSLYIKVYDYTTLRMIVLTFLAMESVLIAITLIYLTKPSLDIIKAYVYIALVFYMIVNVSASNMFVTNLNIRQYSQNTEGELDLLVIGSDGAGLLIDLYEKTDDESLRRKIRWRMVELYGNEKYPHSDIANGSRWQNATLLKSVNRRRVAVFLDQ